MTDATTQTDIDNSGTTTLNITIPNSQVSIFHYDSLATSENPQDAIHSSKLRNRANAHRAARPVSGVIVQPDGDSMSVVSVSLSNRLSVYSLVSSAHSVDKPIDALGSLVFANGSEVISLEVLSPAVADPTEVKESEDSYLKSKLTGISQKSKHSTQENKSTDLLQTVSYENSENESLSNFENVPNPNHLNVEVASPQNPQIDNDSSTIIPQKNLVEILVTPSSLCDPNTPNDESDTVSSEVNSTEIISQLPMLDRGFPGISKSIEPDNPISEISEATGVNIFVPELEEQDILPSAAEFQKPLPYLPSSKHSDSENSLIGPEVTPLPPGTPPLKVPSTPGSSTRGSPRMDISSQIDLNTQFPLIMDATLPTLGFTETINNHDVSRLEEIVSSWPVLKAGYVLRRDVLVSGRRIHNHRSTPHTHWPGLSSTRRGSSPSSTRTNSRKMSISNISTTAADLVSNSSRLFSRSFSNLLAKKPVVGLSRPIPHSNLYHNSNSIDSDSADTLSVVSTTPVSPMSTQVYSPTYEHLLDDDWNVYYAEIRGCYMLFYQVHSDTNLMSMGSRRTSVNPPATPLGVEAESPPYKSFLQRNNSSTLKSNNSQLKKVLKVFNKKSLKIPKNNYKDSSQRANSILDVGLNIKSRKSRGSFSGVGGSTTSVDSVSIASHKSSDSNQSGVSNLTFSAVDKPKQKSLVSYMSLKSSEVQEINHSQLDQMMGHNSNSEILTPTYLLLSTVGPKKVFNVPIPENSTTSNSQSFIPTDQTVFDLILWEELLTNNPSTPTAAPFPKESSPVTSYFPTVTSSSVSLYDFGNKKNTSTPRMSSSSSRGSIPNSSFMLMNYTESTARRIELSEWLNAINSVIESEKSRLNKTQEPSVTQSGLEPRVPTIDVKDPYISPPRPTHHRTTVSDNIGSGVLSPPRSDFMTRPIKNTGKLIIEKFKSDPSTAPSKFQISEPMNPVKIDSSNPITIKSEKLERSSSNREPTKHATGSSPALSPIALPSTKIVQGVFKDITRGKEKDKKNFADQPVIVPIPQHTNQQKAFLGLFKKGSQAFTPLNQPTDIVEVSAPAGVPALINSVMTGLFQPAGGVRILRSETISSKTSTLRRRVGTPTSRPQSGVSQSTGELSTSPLPAPEIPLTLRKCIALVEEIGLETEGLYRVPGSVATVDRLRRLFEADASKVLLYPPAFHSPLVSALSSPFISDFTPNISRRASRMSLTETVSSARSSLDTAAPLLEKNRSLPSKYHKTKSTKSQALQSNQNQPNFFSFYNSQNKDSHTQVVTAKELSQNANSSLYDNDVHVVTGVIKSFLRNGLPPNKEPLCTYASYDQFIEAAHIEDWRNRMIAIQDLVHFLPPHHFATLKFVCDHLYRVSQNSGKNRMNSRNLAIVFGPNILQPPPPLDINRMMEDMQSQCSLVEVMIDQCEWVFGPIEFEEEAVPDDLSDNGDADEELAKEIEGFDGTVYGFDEHGQMGPYASLGRFSPQLPASARQSMVLGEQLCNQEPKGENPESSVEMPSPFLGLTSSDNEDSSESWSNVAVVGIDTSAFSNINTTARTEISPVQVAEQTSSSRNQMLHHSNSKRERRRGVVETPPLSTSLVESYFSNRNDAAARPNEMIGEVKQSSDRTNQQSLSQQTSSLSRNQH
ncbi:hypothetical protein HK096_004682, partial [Nowakowskiella sp. JEL0078]